ncbi:hypothetical protein ZWY2020_045945 [Hordeum vulgare]|nr:hypothetical protein ZWY2020_045945 [Hordeum vulgare]
MAQALVQRACAKLRSAIGDEAVARSNFTADLRDMLEALEHIQPMLDEAEMLLLWESDEISPWLWLQNALTAAYSTIDTVDELQDPRSLAAATMTRMLPRLAIKKNAMAILAQDTKILMMFVQEQSGSLLEYMAENTIKLHEIIKQRETGPVFKEALVLGRGSDKERIIAALLSTEPNIMQEHITILPIFGLACSGKTTLAQMVFNDTHSLQGYDFRVWVHVSPQFDFHAIGNSIISQVSARGQEETNHSSSDMEGMQNIMKRLHELLNGKKALLVLDDLWEEDPIQLQLMDVIVTTWNQTIARKICTVEPYRVNPLSDEACWEIIKKSIRFEGGEEELEKIGWEIASKCRGVPSAARGYAGMLDSSRDAMKWKETMGRDILFYARPVFELSYMSLPPDLRLCFAYCCAIFPSGHIIVKDDLVHDWIALQLIEQSEILSAAQIAEEHITRLQDMSFLQTAELNHASGKDEIGAILFTIHDLAHDFMKRFSENLSYRLATSPHGKLDHMYDMYLRSLHCVGCSKVEFKDDSFSRKKYLHVLELKESSVQKLPDSICKLRHLGYLKISEFTGLVTLPECFGLLKNLFHIDLSGCSRLAALPESFGDLINLTHVNLSRCHGLAQLPEPLHKLGKLVHLDLSFWSCFEGMGKGLGGLTTLEHLNLSSPCCNLAQHPSHLQGLKYGLPCLNPIFYYQQLQEDHLKCLEECVSGLSSLEHLDLSHHTFLFGLPASLGELNKLKTLNLTGCIRLRKVGEMKSVKFINLRKCRGLESCHIVVHIVDDDDVYSSSNIVQLEEVNCQELQISCLEKVKSKEEAERIKLVEKQKLQKLKLSWTLDSVGRVEDSALLRELVPPPNLQYLEVNGYTGTCLPEYLSELTSLQELKLSSSTRCRMELASTSMQVIVEEETSGNEVEAA